MVVAKGGTPVEHFSALVAPAIPDDTKLCPDMEDAIKNFSRVAEDVMP